LLPFDSAAVTITRAADGTRPSQGRWQFKTQTDGNGFYGAVDLAPGQYLIAATPVGGVRYNSPSLFSVEAGKVTEADLRVAPNAFTSPFVTVSAASYDDYAVAPGSIAAGFGANLANTTATADSLPLPVMLGGVSVGITDSRGTAHQARLFFVSPTQINFLVPDEAVLGFARVNALRGVLNLNIDRVAPGIFTANANGQGVAAAIVLRVKADGSSITEPVARFDTAQNRFVPVAIDLSAADEQVFLVLFGTGWRGRSSLAAVQARIGGQAAEVLYAGPQGDFAGLDQINLRLPRSLAGHNGNVSVVVAVDNFSANTVEIGIR
jgi:uncharacterized protein (TIGR03437 family)